MNAMKKAVIAVLTVIGIVLIMASCDRPETVAQAPAPVVVQPATAAVQAPPVIVQQSSNDGFWQGVMLGHLFGGQQTVVHRYDSRPAYVVPRAPVVSNTTIINKTVVRPAPSMPTPARSFSVPAPQPSYMPPRATSYSGSYSSRSSYSSYSSRSSFSSFSGGRR
jgi:hypothetical protein